MPQTKLYSSNAEGQAAYRARKSGVTPTAVTPTVSPIPKKPVRKCPVCQTPFYYSCHPPRTNPYTRYYHRNGTGNADSTRTRKGKYWGLDKSFCTLYDNPQPPIDPDAKRPWEIARDRWAEIARLRESKPEQPVDDTTPL